MADRARPAATTTAAGATRRGTSTARSLFARVTRMQATGSTVTLHAQDPQWRRSGTRAKMQTVADLPPDFVDALNVEETREYERQMTFNGHRRAFAHMVREIYDILDSVGQDKKQLRRIMHEIVQRVLDTSGMHPSMMGAAAPDAMADVVSKERERFLRVGGAECLLRVIHTLRQEDQAVSTAAASSHAPALIVERNQRVKQQRSKMSCRDDMRTLWALPMPLLGERVKNRPDGAARKAILNDAMGVLRELCYFSAGLAYQLCDKDGLIVYLFQLMAEPKFFDAAAGLVEEILAVREESFDLSRIPNFLAIVQSFSSRQLAFFCRVLALVVFEPEDRRLLENSKVIKSLELLQLRRSRMMRADNVVDRNHALLFNAPLVLQRLLVVLQVQNFYFALNPVYEPFSSELATSAEFAMLLSQTSDRSDWESIDQLVNHPALGATGDLTLLHRTRRSNSTEATATATATAADTDTATPQHARHRFSIETAILRDLIFRNRAPGQHAIEDVEAQAIMKSLVLAPHRVEVLFVLCTLLNGKRKIDFQDRLAAMGLVRTLATMFDKFQWTTTVPAPAHAAPLHGPGCDCSLDASLKIQFLRLIHNFCDRDYRDNTSKLLLLSARELALLHDAQLEPIALDATDTDNTGLLCKIIDTLIAQPADSIYRFWLASCVEAFLRRAAPREQLFVARTPLLRALVNEILSGGGYRSPGSFQSAFDLLGEMTKGNWQTLQLFHRMLSNDEFESFMEVVILNLVDSNVFIRSMLLSSEKFAKSTAVANTTFGLAHDDAMDRMSEFLAVNIVRLLRDLMTIVSMDDVNHENICCLNTAIVILIFQHRRQRLPAILDALRSHEELAGKDGYICANFRGLLWFWVQYYTPRGRDRLGLEHSSDVTFDEWKRVVSLLCADDGSPTALLAAPTRLPPSPYSRLYTATAREPRLA